MTFDEYDIGREFAEAAASFTDHGDETLITNFCKKYGIKIHVDHN